MKTSPTSFIKSKAAVFIWIAISICLGKHAVLAVIGEALESPELEWTTSTEGAWVVQSDFTFGSGEAIKATPHPDSQPGLSLETWLKVKTPGPGYIEFFFSANRREGGNVNFEPAGTFLTNLSMEDSYWRKFNGFLPEGEATWVFHYSSGDPSMEFYLDRVHFVPATDPPIKFYKGDLDARVVYEEAGISKLMQVTVIPAAGYEFYRWEGDINSTSPTIQFPYDPNLELKPIVQKSIVFGAFEITTGGDEAWEVSEEALVPGLLANGLQESWMKIHFAQAGVFEFRLEEDSGYESHFSLSLNDTVIEPTLIDPENKRFQVVVPMGGGTAKFAFNWGNNTGERGVTVSDFNFIEGLLVDIRAYGGGNLMVQPSRETYLAGDIITIKATPEPGHFFAGWLDGFPVPIPVNEAFTLRDALIANGVFYPYTLDRFRPFGASSFVPDSDTENSLKSILTTQYFDTFGPGGIETIIQAPATVYFEYNTVGEGSGGGLNVELHKNGSEVLRLDTVPGQWKPYYFDLQDNESHLIQFLASKANFSNFDGVLRDIRVEPGYRLTVEADHGTATKLPDKPNYLPDELVTLEALPEAGFQFIHWIGEEVISESPIVTIPVLTQQNLTARFGSYVDDQSQTWLSWGFPGWKAEFDEASTGGHRYSLSETTVTGPLTTGMRTTMEGPGIFSFEYLLGTDVQDGGFQYQLRIGDTSYPLTRNTSDGWLQFQVAIPDGGQIGEFVRDIDFQSQIEADFSIRSLNFQSGYLLEIEEAGGSVISEPDKSSYSPGEKVVLTAVAGERPFLSWQGDIQSTNPTFELEMNGHKTIQAHFGETFQILDQDYQTSGGDMWIREATGKEISTSLVPGATAHLSTFFETPGTLDFGLSSSPNDWEGKLIINWSTNESSPFQFQGLFEEQLPLSISFFENTNRFDLKVINTSADTTHTFVFEPLEFIPGISFLYSQRAGGIVNSSHPNDRYPKGTVISLEAIPLTGNRFSHWEGLSDQTESAIQISLEESVDVFPVFTLESWAPLPFSTLSSNGNWVISDINPAAGTFSLRAEDPNPDHRNFWIEVEVDGPGVLTTGEAEFSDDPQFSFPAGNSNVNMPSGPSTLRFLANFRNRQKNSYFEIKDLKYQEGYLVEVPDWVEDTFGPIEISPVKNAVLPAGTTLNIQAFPTEFFRFVNWGPGMDSSENPLSIELDQHWVIEPTIVPSEFAVSIRPEDLPTGSNYDFLPTGGPASTAAIQLTSPDLDNTITLWLPSDLGPGLLTFSWKLNDEFGLAYLNEIVDFNYQAQAELMQKNGEWEDASVYIPKIDPGGEETFFFEIRLPANAEFLLGNMQFFPGYQLSTSLIGGTVEMLPNQPIYQANELITLSTISDEPGSTFMGWFGDRIFADANPEFSISQNSELAGFFSKPINYSSLTGEITFLTSPNPAWFTSTGLSLNAQAEEASLLSLQLQGPGLLEWGCESQLYAEPLQVFIGETLATTVETHNTQKQCRLLIPSGSQTVHFFKPNFNGSKQGEYQLTGFKFHSGHAFDLSSPLGSIVFEPYKPVYQNGEAVKVTLHLPDTHQFLGWSGDLDGYPQSFELIMNQSFSAEAKVEGTIRWKGLVWTYEGTAWDADSSNILVSFVDETEPPVSIRTAVAGPQTIYISASFSPQISHSEILLDDVPLASFGNGDWNNSHTMQIPGGNHRIEVRNNKGYISLLDFNLLSFNPDWEWIGWVAQNQDQQDSLDPFVLDKSLDPDGDSLTNYLEYIFRRNPRLREANQLLEFVTHPVNSTPSGTFLKLNHLPLNLPLESIVEIEFSTDLKSWNLIQRIDVTNLESLPEPLEFEIPGYDQEKPLFVRLRVF